MDKERGKLGDKLRNFGAEPPEEIWGNLELKLALRRKRRPFFWWFLAAGLLLPSLGGIWFWNTLETKNQATQNLVIESGKNLKTNQSESNSDEQKDVVTQELKSEKQIIGNQNSVNPIKSSTESVREEKNDAKNEVVKPSIKQTGKQEELIIAAKQMVDENSKKRLPLNKTGKEVLEVFNEGSMAQGNSKSLKSSSKLKSENGGLVFENKINETHPTKGIQNENQPEKKPLETNSIINSDSKQVKAKDNNPIGDNLAQSGQDVENKSQNAVPKIELAKTDSTRQMVKSDTIIAGIKSDSSQRKSNEKPSWFVFAGVKASVGRSISINQGIDAERVSLDPQSTSIFNRLAFDAGLRFEKFMNSWFGINASFGLSYLQDELQFLLPEKVTDYEVVANLNELQVKPIRVNATEKVESSLAAGFLGLGISLRPSQILPVFRMQVAAQSGFWSRNVINSGKPGSEIKEAFKLNEPIYFFQISAGKSIPISKGELWIEPVFQYYPGTVFKFRPGSYSSPGQLGLQLAWKW